jgi:hypothetical protein
VAYLVVQAIQHGQMALVWPARCEAVLRPHCVAGEVQFLERPDAGPGCSLHVRNLCCQGGEERGLLGELLGAVLGAGRGEEAAIGCVGGSAKGSGAFLDRLKQDAERVGLEGGVGDDGCGLSERLVQPKGTTYRAKTVSIQ